MVTANRIEPQFISFFSFYELETTMLAHNVFFTLNENTAENRQKLLSDCQTYLTDHPGVLFFGAGELVEDLDRPVNDHEFDVALHVIFEDRAAHDVYQTAPRHVEFIERNKSTWKQVRVFDSQD